MKSSTHKGLRLCGPGPNQGDLRCPMTTNSQPRFYSCRSAGILILVGVLAGVTVGGGVGVIAASSTKTVTVCANKKTNMLRYAKNGKCVTKTETKVSLNQTVDVLGAPGAAGAKGDAGAVGAKGDAGAVGAKGDAGAKGTVGTAGTKGDAGANATFAITQLSVCDGSDADSVANELCKIGMTGPGGGLIFFVDFNDQYATYNYLEAAPSDGVFGLDPRAGQWSTNTAQCGGTTPQAADCQGNTIHLSQGYSFFVPLSGVALQTVLGLHRGLFGGKAATELIVARNDAGGATKNLYAAGVADDYSTQTASDWWLPSNDELQKMLQNLNNKGVGGFDLGIYWSSSEYYGDKAWGLSFKTGLQEPFSKSEALYVRPVRAF